MSVTCGGRTLLDFLRFFLDPLLWSLPHFQGSLFLPYSAPIPVVTLQIWVQRLGSPRPTASVSSALSLFPHYPLEPPDFAPFWRFLLCRSRCLRLRVGKVAPLTTPNHIIHRFTPRAKQRYTPTGTPTRMEFVVEFFSLLLKQIY